MHLLLFKILLLLLPLVPLAQILIHVSDFTTIYLDYICLHAIAEPVQQYRSAHDTTSTTLIITAVLHADLTPQILRYNEEKDRKVIEYVEDWLSHIEWTNQDVVG